MSVTWYLAKCKDCYTGEEFPVPFRQIAECQTWIDAHSSGTGHHVYMATEVR